MANLSFCHHVSTQLIEYFNTSKYSDITLTITEAKATTPPLEIKAHRILLAVNSPYLAKALAQGEVKEGRDENIHLTVGQGEAHRVRTIVNSFYDKNVITNLSIPDLVSLLESALVYASDDLVQEICEILGKSEPDFKTANLALERFYLIERNREQKLGEELISKMKLKFTKYLSDYFLPLEERLQTHTDFLSLFYGSLWCLVESDSAIAGTENSLLTFVLEWFGENPDRQTAENVGGIFKNIRVKHLSPTILQEMITLDNEVLNKWNGFNRWLVEALGYHARPPAQKKLKLDMNSTVARNGCIGPQAWYISQENRQLCAVRWMVRLSPVEESKRFEPTSHILVRNGMKYIIESVTVDPGDDSTAFDLTLKISFSWSFARQFVLGILPADREYDMSKMFFHSNFAKAFLRWTESSGEEVTSLELSLWSASKEFIDIANKVGLYVCILPVIDDEYIKLSKTNFLFSWGGSCNVQRGKSAVHEADYKIKLEPSRNFSV